MERGEGGLDEVISEEEEEKSESFEIRQRRTQPIYNPNATNAKKKDRSHSR